MVAVMGRRAIRPMEVAIVTRTATQGAIAVPTLLISTALSPVRRKLNCIERGGGEVFFQTYFPYQ